MANNDYTPEIISVYDDVTSPSGNASVRQPERGSYGRGTQEIPDVNTPQDEKTLVAKPGRWSAFKNDRRWRVALGVIFILVAAYLFISGVSYFFTAEADQSELEGRTLEQIVETSGNEIHNVGGPAGALVSHRLVTQGLGLGVVPLFIYFALLGIALLGIRRCKFWSLTFKTLLLAVTISLVLGLIFYNTDSILPPGGYHGFYMNYLLIQRFSWIGALCVSLALVGCLVGVYYYDIMKVWNRYTAIRDARRERRRLAEEERKRMMQTADQYMGSSDQTRYEDEPESTEVPEDPSEALRLALSTLSEPSESVVSQSLSEDMASQAQQEPETEAGEKFRPEPVAEPAETKKTAESEDETPEESEPKEPEITIKEKTEIEVASKPELRKFDPTAELSHYRMPSLDLLSDRPTKIDSVDISEIEDKKNQIIEALSKYGIGISKIEATVGPTVTMYEIVPAEGVKIATIKRLEEDIAMALAALSTRIIAPIPGKSAIGIEVPNREPQMVSIRTILGSKAFQECNYELPIALGTTIDNEVYIADLHKMPHLLVAGATGKGKSVGMNVIINSLLYKKHPAELKIVLVDPKMVEFYPYRKIENHYLAKVPDAEEAIITDTSKVVDTLKSLCTEMDNRYRLLQNAEVVKITDYNKLFIDKKLNPNHGHRFMPYIVVIVDEYADLVMTAGKEVETPIARLAQKARAVGIHVIIATQRPSANVITGIIKGNFPARIAFKVASGVDSKIILDTSGAQQLIGNGDMLISQDSEIKRVQCAFISTDEIKNVTNHIEKQVSFGHAYELPDPPASGDKDGGGGAGGDLGEDDSLLEEVARAIVTSGVASTSNVQRRWSVGYNRAGRIMDQLHALGIVGPAQGGKPRDILVDAYQLEEILQNRN